MERWGPELGTGKDGDRDELSWRQSGVTGRAEA